MNTVKRAAAAGAALALAALIGCSGKPQPMKNGPTGDGAAGKAPSVPVNPRNPKKRMEDAFPDGPQAPPVR